MKTQLVASLVLAGATLLVPLGAATAAAQPATAIILQVDRPMTSEQLENQGSFGGWAVDQNSITSPGISQVSVYMDGDATTGRFLGQAQLGGARPDVAAQLGNVNYTNSGWNFSLAPLGIVGEHSFTFVASGIGGTIASKNVGSVALVPTPILGYQSQVYQPAPSAYPAPAYTAPAYAAPAYTAPTYTAPAYTNPAPIYTTPASYAYNPGAYSAAGSSFLAPPPVPPIASVPGAIAPLPVTISIAAPATGSPAGGTLQVSGSTSVVPLNGVVSYTLADLTGAVVTSGSLGVTGVPGQPGIFSGTLTYPPGVRGPATLTVTQTDGGNIVATNSATVTLASYTAPLKPAPYYYPYYLPR